MLIDSVSKIKMAPRGFEPPTPGLRVQYSDRAELRGLKSERNYMFLNVG